MSLVVASLLGVYLHRELDVTAWLVWFTLLFTVASGAQYVMRGLRIVHGREDAGKPN
jgi:phosphatidylglycerophosphate synthase